MEFGTLIIWIMFLILIYYILKKKENYEAVSESISDSVSFGNIPYNGTKYSGGVDYL